MRILIVEDEPTLQAQLADGLGAAGYAVDTADNGVDAHAMGDGEPYDAVVLDLGLPQMDGLTVLRKWRAVGRKMPVLILTARDGWHENCLLYTSLCAQKKRMRLAISLPTGRQHHSS